MMEENKITNEEKDIEEDAKKKALEKLKNTKVGIINIEEIAEAEARKAADAYMTEDKGKVGFFKKLWKHTFFDEYYRQRQVNRIRKQIVEEENIYTGRTGDDKKLAHRTAMKSISERFVSEYEDTAILNEGEERKFLEDKDPEAKKAQEDIRDLIIKYATGTISEDVFRNEKTRILDNLKNQDLLKGSNNFADNLFEVAKNAKLAIEHGAKVEELDFDTNIIIGKAKSSLKTEAHFNFVDKGVDWMKKTKVGRFVSPAVLSTATGIAYCAAVKFLGSKAGSSLLGLGGAVAISATFAGINESQRIALERKQHAVEMAEGQEYEAGSKRREQMEQFQYQMEKSSVLSGQLRSVMFEKDPEGNEVLKNFSKDDLDQIFGIISDIDARKALNSKNKIDLIAYENIGSVEKENTDLTILVAKAKVELRRRLETDLKDGLPTGETYESYLQKQTEAVENSLLGGEKGITAQDKAFRKYKAKRVAKKVLQTATIGFVIGGTIQEVAALGNDEVQGVFEGMAGKNNEAMTETPFEHIHNWIIGEGSHLGLDNPVENVINGNIFHTPEGTSILQNTDGTFDIFKGDKLFADNIKLTFDPDGNLDSDSLVRLGESGIVANTTHTVVESTQEVTSSAEDFLINHGEGAHEIDRLGWYDNDTPKPIFDQNELKLWWGGDNNVGINADGQYEFDISHMTEDGSFHQNFSVDAEEAMKNGTLKMIFSLTEGTQTNCFEVPIDPSGNVIIDPESEIGKLFFSNENGQAVFKGRFAEVVQSFGVKDGVDQIKTLATLEGPGNDAIKDIVKNVVDTPTHNLDLPKDVQPPWFIPVVARKPLEKVQNQAQTEKFPIQETIVSKKDENNQDRNLAEDVILVGNDQENVIKEDILNDDNKIIGFEEGSQVVEETKENVFETQDENEIKEINSQENIEMTQEEYDGMKDDLKMLNKKIQETRGIINLSEDNFKSEYGRKRYRELSFIGEGKPVRFNQTELQTIGDEMERMLIKAKVLSLEEIERRKKEKIEKDNIADDLKMLNSKIRRSEGIITLEENDFKSEYGKKWYSSLRHIPDGKPVTFNKDELLKIGDSMERFLMESQKKGEIISKKEINKKEIKIEEDDSEKNGGKEEEIKESDFVKRQNSEEILINKNTEEKESLQNNEKKVIQNPELPGVVLNEKGEFMGFTGEKKQTKIEENIEIISNDSIKKIIEEKLKNYAKIEKLDLNFKNEGWELDGELNAGLFGGKIRIKGVLENSGDSIVMKKNPTIEARGYVKTRIENNLSKLFPEIQKYFEEQYKRKIKSMKIEENGLSLNFEN